MAGSRRTQGPPTSAPDLEILGDQVTLHPSGYVEAERKDDGKEQVLMQHMARFRTSPLEFLREVSLHVSGKGWRSYDNFIGQPIFYSGFSENMKAAVMATPILQRKIADLAEMRVLVEEKEGLLNKDDPMFAPKRAQRRAAIEQSLQEVAEGLTDGMICKFESKAFIRGAYYLCTQVCLYCDHNIVNLLTCISS
jgi:hypothetical protein